MGGARGACGGCGRACCFARGLGWVDAGKLHGAFTGGGGVVFLQGFEVALFLQGDQRFHVAVEFVDVAHVAFEGLDLIAQGLHGAGLALQAVVDTLDLFEQVVGVGSHLFGGFTGHALDQGFGLFE